MLNLAEDSFDWLILLCLMYCKMQSALLAARAHCWLMLSCCHSAPWHSFLLPYSYSFPSLYLSPIILNSTCRTRCLPLLTFMMLMIVEWPNVSKSYFKSSHPFRDSKAPPSLASCWEWISLLHPILKMLKSAGPRTEPWGTSLVTDYQPDVAPFTKTLWAILLSQFLTQQNMNSSTSQMDTVFRRMALGMVSKASLKSRKIMVVTDGNKLCYTALIREKLGHI